MPLNSDCAQERSPTLAKYHAGSSVYLISLRTPTGSAKDEDALRDLTGWTDVPRCNAIPAYGSGCACEVNGRSELNGGEIRMGTGKGAKGDEIIGRVMGGMAGKNVMRGYHEPACQ